MFGETDLLWNELQLDSLIDEDVNENSAGAIFYNFHHKNGKAAVGLVSPSKSKNKLDGDELLLRNDREGPQKIMEVFKKPAYSALINRYQSLPHKPKTIQLNKLNLLADPIKGRYSRRLLDSEDSNDQVGESNKVSSNAQNISKQDAVTRKEEVVTKKKEPSSAFFLTETDMLDESDDNDDGNIGGNQVAPRGGFAAALRGEVGVNRTRNTSNATMRRQDPLMKGNNRNNNRVSNKKQGTQINMPLRKSIKKAWDNAVVNSVKDSRNSRVSKSLLTNVNKDQMNVKKNDFWKKTASSGYGKRELPRMAQQPKMSNIIKKGGLADGRREGRSTVTKQLIKGMRAENAQQAISRMHTNWDRNLPPPEQQPGQRSIYPTGSEGAKANEDLLFKDRFSLAGLESISETIAERAKRLQNTDPPQKPARKDLKRPQRLSSSGTQSAPSQLQLPPQPQVGIHQVLLDEVLRSSKSLVSKDDQHLSLPPISAAAPLQDQAGVPAQKRRDSRSDSATTRERARAEREAASQRKPQLQQQRTKAMSSTDTKTSNKISITSLITRRIQKAVPPDEDEEEKKKSDKNLSTSKSPLRMFPPPIVALDGENDSLGNFSDELLLQEIKKDILIMKSSPLAAAIPSKKEDASLLDSLEPTETELKEDLLQYEQIEKKAQQLKSEAAQHLVHQMKKLGSHFSAAQKLSDQYKSVANEFSGLSFLS